jgi:hypothetical protein
MARASWARPSVARRPRWLALSLVTILAAGIAKEQSAASAGRSASRADRRERGWAGGLSVGRVAKVRRGHNSRDIGETQRWALS